MADSVIYLSKLDTVLKRFNAETSNDLKSKTLNDQSSQSKTNVGSTSSVVILRDGEELTIRDLIAPVTTKGRPKGASRLKSSFEDFFITEESEAA